MPETKIKKKKWYSIIAPKLFNNAIIGEVPLLETKSIIGRKVKVNLMSITSDIKRQNINVTFLITNFENNRATTELIGYSLTNSSIKRMVRRGLTRIDTTVTCKTSDKKDVKLKFIVITYGRVVKNVSNSIKKLISSEITKYCEKGTYESLVKEIISSKLQKELKNKAKKIHPIKILEVRSMEKI